MSQFSGAALRGSHLHFDPTAGIAGDMTVAALVDLGVPAEVVTQAITALGLEGLHTSFEARVRGGFTATGFVVSWPQPSGGAAFSLAAPGQHVHHHEHRDYAEIKRLLQRSPLAAGARDIAQHIFHRIAVVEAARHGVPVDEVAFHEVGAWDSIADIVGVAAALAHLAPVSISASPAVLGSGQVRTAHGLLPVPAPATAALLEGLPVIGEGQGELTTPTGAAILASIVTRFGPPPPMRLLRSGHGAGTKQLADRPNVLRVMAGVPLGAPLPEAPSEVLLVAANLDDMSGEMVAPLIEALFQAGAVDAWSAPIFMKKGRPAVEVSTLVPSGNRAAVEAAFFRHSTTLGVRIAPMSRTVLPRSTVQVQTSHGAVRVKVGVHEGQPITAAPEFEDCRALAEAAGVPVRVVYAEAQARAHAQLLAPAPAAAAGGAKDET